MNNRCPELEQDFPEELPQLGENEHFHFECGPQNPCFNRCCAELTLPLTPYDAMRLIRQSGMASTDFIQMFIKFSRCPVTGFPQATLRMLDGPGALCPFVTPAGCSVYDDRPSACRCYPLGRGAKIAHDGISERFFLVREDHCKGFETCALQTPAKWLKEQGMDKYTAYSDRYMRLLSMVSASKIPLDSKLASMSILCLYQPDRFRDFIESMRIFEHVDMDRQSQEKILESSDAGDEALLAFALDWLELILFGKCANLRRKK